MHSVHNEYYAFKFNMCYVFQDALLKTRSKDDITRKLMERMRKKKQLGEAEESSSFLARNKAVSFSVVLIEAVCRCQFQYLMT